MTFKRVKHAHIFAVTDKAVKLKFRDDHPEDVAVWVARSNLRSDVDKRMEEIRFQLEAHDRIVTDLEIAEWLVRKEGWLEKCVS